MKKYLSILILLLTVSAFALPTDSVTNYVAGIFTNNNIWSGTNGFGMITNNNGSGATINMVNQVIKDSGGALSENWNSRWLTDASTGISVYWQNRLLEDSLQNTALDWQNYYLAGNWTSTNLTATGTFSGNGGGLTNVSATISATNISAAGGLTNGQGPIVNFNFQLPVMTYGVTNPIDVYGAIVTPWYNGHYVWSASKAAYTNTAMYGGTTNYFRYNPTLQLWEFTTNLVDLSGDNINTYTYIGNNNFPTNDPVDWAYGLAGLGNVVATNALFIGTTNGAFNNFSAVQIKGYGEEVHNAVSTIGDPMPNADMFSISDISQVQMYGLGPQFSFGIDNAVYGLNGQTDAVFDMNGHQYGVNYNNVNTIQYCIDGARIGIERWKGVFTNGFQGIYHVSEDISGLADGATFDYYVKDEYCHQLFGNLGPFHSAADATGAHSVGWVTIYGGGSNGLYNPFPTLLIAPTNLPSVINNGGFSAGVDGRVYVDQQGVRFSIPQITQTNVPLSAATTFTWTWPNGFADTNASFSASGKGATLVAPVFGAVTTNSVVVTFTAFTGILSLIAAHQ